MGIPTSHGFDHIEPLRFWSVKYSSDLAG